MEAFLTLEANKAYAYFLFSIFTAQKKLATLFVDYICLYTSK